MSQLTDYWLQQQMQDIYDEAGDERDLPPNKQAEYAERQFEAADMRRKESREEAYEQVERLAVHFELF